MNGIPFSRAVGFDMRTSELKSVGVTEALSTAHISWFRPITFDMGPSDLESA